ncbi:conserved hypothetical protein [Hyphomicrobiales bacterium]|nr:conserved hypothetical protein [Hyphomicrobiales bacterium]CAH1691358.1 conserved hypothetical protein [Hyphomicrobiales bacterium]
MQNHVAMPSALDSADFVKFNSVERSATEQLAAFAADLQWDDIPAAVRERAKHLLIDIIGIGLAGSANPDFARLADALAQLGAAPGVSLIGTASRLSPPNAALFNGMVSHSLDWDDTHMATINHASSVIVPTALAVGELRGASVRDILTAMVAGYEVMLRVGLGIDPLDWWKHGLHGTSILGVFGSAVTAGKLFGLSADELMHAMGLAASQASGIQQYASPGEVNDAKRFHSGWPALCGVTAAGLAAGGLTAPRQVLEGVRSLYKCYLGHAARNENAIVAELGSRWETLRISVKVYPCCQGFQAPMEVTQRLRKRLGAVSPAAVGRIEIAVAPGQQTLIQPVAGKRRPQSHSSAVIALQFCMGVMLARGRITLADFSPQMLEDQDVLAFADLVDCSVDPNLPARHDGSKVKLTLRDGRELLEEVACYHGGPDNPLSPEGFRDKFMISAGSVLGKERTARLADVLFSVEDKPSSVIYEALPA